MDNFCLENQNGPVAGASILGLGVTTPTFWAGGRGVAGDRRLVVKYYYILLCTGSMFESGDY